jgi:hypothetical protein
MSLESLDMMWTRQLMEYEWFYSKYNWRIFDPTSLRISPHTVKVFPTTHLNTITIQLLLHTSKLQICLNLRSIQLKLSLIPITSSLLFVPFGQKQLTGPASCNLSMTQEKKFNIHHQTIRIRQQQKIMNSEHNNGNIKKMCTNRYLFSCELIAFQRIYFHIFLLSFRWNMFYWLSRNLADCLQLERTQSWYNPPPPPPPPTL